MVKNIAGNADAIPPKAPPTADPITVTVIATNTALPRAMSVHHDTEFDPLGAGIDWKHATRPPTS